MGIEVEKEHTDNPKIALKIALDHLKEDPKYYTKLKTIHTDEVLTEGILLEGGAAGHMQHPYEDMDLTFNDYREMMHRALVGNLGTEEPPTEKLDGQNIQFTVRDGKIKFARNKGHVKNAGENAMAIPDIIEKFKDHPTGVSKAFVESAKDLQSAISKLPNEQVYSIFGDGKSFMNLEIILPDSQNVIPYGKSVLVFHGTTEYDEAGNKIGGVQDHAHDLNKMIRKVGAEQQKTFGIEGPHSITMSNADLDNNAKRLAAYIGKLDSLRSEFNLSNNSPIGDYYKAWWERELDNEFQRHHLQPDESTKDALVRRFAFGDKSHRLTSIKDKNIKKWASDYQKNKHKQMHKKVQRPFEMLFLRVGADSLRRVENFMASNNPVNAEKLKAEVDKVIATINSSDFGDKADKMAMELERLTKIGVDKLVPSEGIVFTYNGNPYKFTGTFAPINQLMGAMRFGNATPSTKKSPKKAPKISKKSVNPEKSSKMSSSTSDSELKKQEISKYYNHKITNPETGNQITIKSALGYDNSHPAKQLATKFIQSKVG